MLSLVVRKETARLQKVKTKLNVTVHPFNKNQQDALFTLNLFQ